MKHSSEVKWDNRPEQFEFLSVFFDVSKAKQMVMEKPRDIVHFPLAGLSLFLPLIRKKATRKVDLSIPILVVTIDCGYLPIDGWHRVEEAMVVGGVEKLPAVIFNYEETRTLFKR